jgi:PIN domain nuclease of toxin-antitoxin system
MILLDTHVWIWYINQSIDLRPSGRVQLDDLRGNGFAISDISMWEVAKLVEKGRLQLKLPVEEWIGQAIRSCVAECIRVGPEVAVQSTRLLGFMSKDPADQIIAATAIVHEIELATADSKILEFANIRCIDLRS